MVKAVIYWQIRGRECWGRQAHTSHLLRFGFIRFFKAWTMEASVAGHNVIVGTAPDTEFWEHSLLIISYTTKSF